MKLSKANSDQSQQPISHEPLPDKSEGALHSSEVVQQRMKKLL